jgi:hypothetical protein
MTGYIFASLTKYFEISKNTKLEESKKKEVKKNGR